MTSEEFRNNELFLRNQFDVSGRFDMTNIQGPHFDVNHIELIGFDQISSHDTTNKWVHFFLDDYKFESVYNHSHEKVEKFEQCAGILTPNFSMYVELPLSLQIYNTFKSRWVGAFMQKRGIPVIPTVNWGDRDSFSFCFDGIEPGFIVSGFNHWG